MMNGQGFWIGVAIWVGAVTMYGCAAAPHATVPDPATLKAPTKDILVIEGDINKPYDVLGSVEVTLGGKSIYSAGPVGISPEIAREARQLLRNAAYTKYGERLDGLINVKVAGAVTGGFGGFFTGAYGAPTGVVSASGIAISFK